MPIGKRCRLGVAQHGEPTSAQFVLSLRTMRAINWVIIVAAGCGKVDMHHEEPDAAPPPASCSDGAPNGDETDVDCGGSCGPCGADAKCEVDRDCASNRCSAGQCSPSCELGGLVAYFPFDGDTLDRSGNHHDIVASHVAATTGAFGAGYAFDGATSAMQLTGAGTLGARTLCAWVDAMDVQDLGNPVFGGGAPTAGDFFSLAGVNPAQPCGAAGEPFVDHWGTPCYQSGMPVTSGRWSFICYSSDGGTALRFYRDGSSLALTGSLFNYAIATMTVGSTGMGGTTTHASMLGSIDEVTVWDHALGLDELDRLYNHGRSCVP